MKSFYSPSLTLFPCFGPGFGRLSALSTLDVCDKLAKEIRPSDSVSTVGSDEIYIIIIVIIIALILTFDSFFLFSLRPKSTQKDKVGVRFSSSLYTHWPFASKLVS